MARAEIKGLNAVVTGGSKGIGKATVELLEEYGYNVLAGDSKMGDLSNENGINQFIDFIDFDQIDVLVNNAGYTKYVDPSSWYNIDDTLFDKIMNVNVKAPFKLIKKLRDRFVDTSCIVNVASVAGITGNGSNIAYCASKAAVINMTKALARNMAPIRVNSVSPGLIKTGFVKFPDEYYEKTVDQTPVGIMGQPIHIAKAILNLIDCEYSSGIDVIVDGGRILN
jgi:3-oxoacyl-[acyl-carrier protein] reductase